MKIISINLGQAEILTDNHGKSFTSCVRKKPTVAEVAVGFNGLAGDSVADTLHHGGVHRALHLFCFEHYPFFNAKNGAPLPIPSFGENITLQGYVEQQANVGDILKIGSAVVQVSQPTERCSTMGKALHQPKLLKWIHEKMMSGFYLRVLTEGTFSKISSIEVIEKGPDELNIDALNQLLFKTAKNIAKLNCYCL